jgi:hypothetical protein
MAEPAAASITQLLIDWSAGNCAALDELTLQVHRELHALARTYLSRDRRNQTLQSTALINELYVRLIGQRRCPPGALPRACRRFLMRSSDWHATQLPSGEIVCLSINSGASC